METINIKLLDRIYQNAKTGSQSIEELLEKIKDDDFKSIVVSQQSQYDIVAKECEMIAKSKNTEPKDNNFFTKMKQSTMVGLSTLTDKSVRHMAELMMQGTAMGIVDIIEALCDYHCADEEILKMGKNLQTMQEKYFDELKKYLK